MFVVHVAAKRPGNDGCHPAFAHGGRGSHNAEKRPRAQFDAERRSHEPGGAVDRQVDQAVKAKQFRQGAQSRLYHVEAPVVRQRHVEDRDAQRVAGLGASNCDRAGENMGAELLRYGSVDLAQSGIDSEAGAVRRDFGSAAAHATHGHGVAGIDDQDGRKSCVEIAPMDSIRRRIQRVVCHRANS